MTTLDWLILALLVVAYFTNRGSNNGEVPHDHP